MSDLLDLFDLPTVDVQARHDGHDWIAYVTIDGVFLHHRAEFKHCAITGLDEQLFIAGYQRNRALPVHVSEDIA